LRRQFSLQKLANRQTCQESRATKQGRKEKRKDGGRKEGRKEGRRYKNKNK
jgi:hypothetical protein